MKDEISKTADYSSNKLEDSRVFELFQSEKTESLKESMEDIQEAIRLRKQLSEEVTTLFNKVIIDTDNFIIRLNIVDRNNEIIRGEQMKLKQKQMEIEAKKIEERVNCWKDVALLKKELREHLAEFRDKESRSTMLDNLLDSNI
jgi:hypothetical protein